APEAGRVTRLHVAKGEIAKVHAPLYAYDAGSESDTQAVAEPASEESEREPKTQVSTGASAKDFILPDIGEGIVECEVVEWHVREGDNIAEDQPVVEVMTDKAMVEITAPEAGQVSQLYIAKGEIARVHAPLFAYLPEASSDAT